MNLAGAETTDYLALKRSRDLGAEGVLVELVQAPDAVREAFEALG